MTNTNNYFTIVFLMVILFLGVSCVENEVAYVIEEEVIVKILFDIHIVEAAVQQGDVSQRDSLRNLYYNQIFEVHDISKNTYEEEMELLKRDAKKLSTIYDKVIDQLKERKEKIVEKK